MALPLSRQPKRPNRPTGPVVAALVSGAICLTGYVLDRAGAMTVPGLERLEQITVDARFRLRGPDREAPTDIAIIGIDDRTYEEEPEIFLRRRGWARLVRALAAYQPKRIAIDAYFRSPEINLSPELVARARSTIAKLTSLAAPSAETSEALSILQAIDDETRGDDELIRAMADAGNVSLATMLFTDEAPADEAATEPAVLAKARLDEGVIVAAPKSARPRQASHAAGSFPAITGAATGAGFANIAPDDDGVVRRVPLVIEHGGRLYMPLGIAMARAATDQRIGYAVGSDSVHFGDSQLPVNRRAEAHLRFRGPRGAFATYSASDVLRGTLPADALRGKLVFVGFTDRARDKVTTPFAEGVDGVELHATVADNALRSTFLRPPRPALTLLTMAAIVLLVALMHVRRVRQQRAWLSGVAALVLAAVLLAAAHAAFAAGTIVELAAPLVTLLATSMAAMSVTLMTLGREKAELRGLFSQYVPGSVVDRILAAPDEVRLGGERRELTVMFSDIRGFSSFAEDLPPEALSELMSEYFTPMTRRVLEGGGMLDKYIGDAIMAVYGAPLPQDDHAERACRTALAWIDALAELNAGWAARGLPRIAIGVGINTGPMAVGNMGSETRFDYTVIGDAVNLGARLEGVTKTYRVPILTGPRTRELAGDLFVFRELDSVRVRGRTGTCPIYQLVGSRDRSPLGADDLERYARALSAYRERDWEAARDGFARYLRDHPGDGPAELLLSRTAVLREHDPGPDWDGVYTG